MNFFPFPPDFVPGFILQNGMNIFPKPYSNLIQFGKIFIHPYPSPNIQHLYPDTKSYIYMMLISITVLSGKKTNTIHIQLRSRMKIWKQI